jgi:prolyl oligopeptidase
MTRTPILAALALLLSATTGSSEAPPPRRPAYPPTRIVGTVDTMHGTKVADPFRWLERLDEPEAWAWVEAQNKLTAMILDQIPGRDAIRDRLSTLSSVERTTTPIPRGERSFFTRNDGLQPHDLLLVQDSPASEPRVLIDPAAFSTDGTVSVSEYSVNHDGSLVAYALSNEGSDWQDWHVREVATGKDRNDWVKWARFNPAAWAADGSGFFYTRYGTPAPGQDKVASGHPPQVRFHRLGTPQSADELIYERPDRPDWGFRPEVSDDGRYLVLTVSVGSDRRDAVVYADLAQSPRTAVELVGGFEADFDFVGNDGPVFYFRTDSGAPRGRLIAIDIRTPQRAAWREVLAEQRDALQGVDLFHDTFVARFLQDASSRVRTFRTDGTPAGEVSLPGLGSIGPFTGTRRQDAAYCSFAGFTAPAVSYRLDVRTGAIARHGRPGAKPDADRFVTSQVFYTSKDGTRVPMFLTHKKTLAAKGPHPTLLHGFGGFAISMTPSFTAANQVWMEMGGIYAVPNLRGGGEYGEAWHRAGMLKNKQNVFDDFIAAAEHLVQSGLTTPRKLAVSGASNGGLLVGAVLNRRPDLFGAAVPAMGFMDMLRYHHFPLGWALVAEYGSPDDPSMFPVLHAYSPLHNIRKGTSYPPTLISVPAHDDRIPAGPSLKYAAALQAAQGSIAPVLIRIQTTSGRGAAGSASALTDEAADRLAFLVKALDMPTPKW